MTDFKRIHFFEGLNPLRFFAALLVVMHHAETIRAKNGLYHLQWLGLFRNGSNAVSFFFVLSGFLISYLLLKEDFETNTISIRNFYIKRALRIWPLYFLLVIIGCILLPHIFSLLHVSYEMPYTFRQVWYYFLFFFPGLVTFFFGHHLLEPLWSIGVEEIFYLIWAPLFKRSGRQGVLQMMFTVLGVKIILMIMVHFFIKAELFSYVVNMLDFEDMAVGGIGAYWIFNRTKPLTDLYLYRKPVQVVIYAILAAYLIFYTNADNKVWNLVFRTPIVSSILIDLLFLYLIIGSSLVGNSIIKPRSKYFSYLGEISYGIYMYHMLVIFFMLHFFRKYLVALPPVASSLFFYSLLLALVILVAAVSKFTFENYFLRFRKKLPPGRTKNGTG